MPEISRFFGIIIRMFFKDHVFEEFNQDNPKVIKIEPLK